MKHIAVVEDEALMREELADMLRRAGYAVTEVTDFADVTGQLLALAPDLVLLDLNLPEVSGFQICRDLKRRSALPVLVLTSRDQLRDEVLDDYRPLLEEKGFRVEIRPTDETVFADRRGLCFLLGQVVSNSVKYALEKPVLTFSLESNDTATVLSIRDNGPGVRACDLPYVFEKGFTGDSGHEKNKATGMGLYLAREVAKDLGLTLTAASDWGAGFEIRVTFPVVEE